MSNIISHMFLCYLSVKNGNKKTCVSLSSSNNICNSTSLNSIPFTTRSDHQLSTGLTL